MSEERGAPYRVKDVNFYASPFFRRLKAALPIERLPTALVLCDWAILRGGRLGATPNPGLGDFGMTFRVADIHGLVSAVSAAGLFRFDDATGWLWLPSGVRWQNVSWMLKSKTPEWAPSSASPNAIKTGAVQWQGLWRDIDELLSGDFPFKREFVRENAEGLFLSVAAQRCAAISAALSASTESAHLVPPLSGATEWSRAPSSEPMAFDHSMESRSGSTQSHGVPHGVQYAVKPLSGFPRRQETGVIKKQGPAHDHTPTRESIEGTAVEIGGATDSEHERTPLVARSVLHPRELTPEEIAILETPIGGDEAFDLTAPMPELPSMKGRSRKSVVEQARELYAHQEPEVQAKRIAEVEAYQAKVDARQAEAAAVRDPEDAAFEAALADWVDLYSLDERAHKLIKRSVSEIPQGLEAHHDACRQAAATIGSKYAKAVGSPLGMPGKVAVMRAVLLLTEDGRVSVPGAVERLNAMLDWWTATDGNPKRRGADGKDWFADVMAVFGGKETVQAASGVPRDAGSVLMVNLNAAAAWKASRERKLDVAKDPFAATGGETYRGILHAIKAAKAAVQ
jgi:hypothetical protein